MASPPSGINFGYYYGDGNFWILGLGSPDSKGGYTGIPVTIPNGWCLDTSYNDGYKTGTKVIPTNTVYRSSVYISSFDYSSGLFSNTAQAYIGTSGYRDGSPSGKLLIWLYDKHLDLNAKQALRIYVPINNCKSGQKTLLRLGDTWTYNNGKGTSNLAGTGSMIMLTRSTANANTVDSKPVVTNGNVDFGLNIQLQSQLASIWSSRGTPNICSLTITYVEGKQTKQIVKASEKKDSKGKVIACTGKLPVNSSIIPTGFLVKPVGSGNTTLSFTASVKANISSNATQQVISSYTTPPLKVSYNTTTAVVNEQTSDNSAGYAPATNNPAPLSGESAVGPESGDQDSTYDECSAAFGKSTSGHGLIAGWGSYWLVGQPLCQLISIIVSAATHLATYALQYFFKPALGLV